MAIHSWGPPKVVEVPWGAAGGNLYTCVKCGATRQSRPNGSFFTSEFRLPGGKTPPCQPVVSPQKA